MAESKSTPATSEVHPGDLALNHTIGAIKDALKNLSEDERQLFKKSFMGSLPKSTMRYMLDQGLLEERN